MGIFGWDLPPGVSNADIEAQCETEKPCSRCRGNGMLRTAQPKEHNVFGRAKCPKCDGSGIEPESDEGCE